MREQNILKKCRSEEMLGREGEKSPFEAVRILFAVKNTRVPLPLSCGICMVLIQRSELSEHRSELCWLKMTGELLGN